MGLSTDTSIAETDTTFTEVAGTGYAQVSIARDAVDWTASFSGGDWIATSKNCVFTASGTWTTAKKLVFIATLNSVDTLIGYADLTADRTLVSGDTLTLTIVHSLS